jgi:prepilin-type processing-associated H-X9-DG protein
MANDDAEGKKTGEHADVEGGSLFTYAKSAALYVCPSDPDGETKRLSYSMPCSLNAANPDKVKGPSELILLMDEEHLNDPYIWAKNFKGGNTAYDRLTIRHNNTGNLLFVDGHVKAYTYAQFPTDPSDPDPEIAKQAVWNKARDTGAPRFHDPGLDRNNSSSLGYRGSSDSCLGSIPLAPADKVTDPSLTPP